MPYTIICNYLYECLNQGKNNIRIETVEFSKTFRTVLRSNKKKEDNSHGGNIGTDWIIQCKIIHGNQ